MKLKKGYMLPGQRPSQEFVFALICVTNIEFHVQSTLFEGSQTLEFNVQRREMYLKLLKNDRR